MPDTFAFAHRQLSWVAVRVDVFVDTPMAKGWFSAFFRPKAENMTNDGRLARACRVYQAWVASLQKQTPRATYTHALAVRLVVDMVVVAGFGLLPTDELWLLKASSPIPVFQFTKEKLSNAKSQRSKQRPRRVRK